MKLKTINWQKGKESSKTLTFNQDFSIISMDVTKETVRRRLGITAVYFTIRLFALDFYGVIVDGGEARINYRAIEIESE